MTRWRLRRAEGTTGSEPEPAGLIGTLAPGWGLLPLILLTIFFGAYPAPILDIFGHAVEGIIKPLNEAAAAAHLLATASLQ